MIEHMKKLKYIQFIIKRTFVNLKILIMKNLYSFIPSELRSENVLLKLKFLQ